MLTRTLTCATHRRSASYSEARCTLLARLQDRGVMQQHAVIVSGGDGLCACCGVCTDCQWGGMQLCGWHKRTEYVAAGKHRRTCHLDLRVGSSHNVYSTRGRVARSPPTKLWTLCTLLREVVVPSWFGGISFEHASVGARRSQVETTRLVSIEAACSCVREYLRMADDFAASMMLCVRGIYSIDGTRTVYDYSRSQFPDGAAEIRRREMARCWRNKAATISSGDRAHDLNACCPTFATDEYGADDSSNNNGCAQPYVLNIYRATSECASSQRTADRSTPRSAGNSHKYLTTSKRPSFDAHRTAQLSFADGSTPRCAGNSHRYRTISK